MVIRCQRPAAGQPTNKSEKTLLKWRLVTRLLGLGQVPGVNAQEETRQKLISSLREILSEALEFNRSEARQSAGGSYTEELVTV